MSDLDYSQGRFAAMVDLVNWLEKHSEYIKWAKLNNWRGLLGIVECLAENADEFERCAEFLELSIKRDGKKLRFSVEKGR